MSMSTLTEEKLSSQARGSAAPSVVMVFPFDPKMMSRNQLEPAIKRLLGAAEKELLAGHAADEAMPMIKRLQQALRGLDYSTHKRSVAIWVSAARTTTLHLNFAVEERLFVDRPFYVRDLAGCKPSGKEYLVLLLSTRESKLFLQAGGRLRLIKNNGLAEGETTLDKFLQQMDHGLGHILKAYPLPVFVAGPERVVGHFSRLTHYSHNIAGYVHKQGMHSTQQELETILQPLLANWHQLRQKLLLLQLEKAWEAGKLVCGSEEVRKAARSGNSRLVVLEATDADPADVFAHDPLDPIVEKVLANGGDIAVLDSGGLARFGPIALIRYYRGELYI